MRELPNRAASFQNEPQIANSPNISKSSEFSAISDSNKRDQKKKNTYVNTIKPDSSNDLAKLGRLFVKIGEEAINSTENHQAQNDQSIFTHQSGNTRNDPFDSGRDNTFNFLKERKGF